MDKIYMYIWIKTIYIHNYEKMVYFLINLNKYYPNKIKYICKIINFCYFIVYAIEIKYLYIIFYQKKFLQKALPFRRI